MLETCGSPLSTDKRDKPVPIDHTSETVIDFLDLIHFGTIKGRYTWKRCQTLLSIIDQFDAPKLKSLAVQPLFEVLPEYPFNIFAMASQSGNVPLAKMAIAHFPIDMKRHGALEMTSKTVCDIRLDFLVGLLSGVPYGTNGATCDWKKVAHSFELAKTN